VVKGKYPYASAASRWVKFVRVVGDRSHASNLRSNSSTRRRPPAALHKAQWDQWSFLRRLSDSHVEELISCMVMPTQSLAAFCSWSLTPTRLREILCADCQNVPGGRGYCC
jgi:hypothetical protein